MKSSTVLSALVIAAPAVMAAVPLYGQCGGANYTGETTCVSGAVCVYSNEWYSQCLPGTASSSVKTSTSSTKTSSSSTKTSSSSTKTTSTPVVTAAPTGITTALPASSGYTAFATASVITGTFDGGMKRFDRAGSSGDCQGQTETGEDDAVFILESGATIQNVIIGAAQAEGIHCRGPCTVKNVWWADVCEDAITLKQSGASDVSYIIGGGAFGADDKIVQHNGKGTVQISNFYAKDFGKLYRSCGNCSGNGAARHVVLNNVAMINGKEGVGINSNYGDTATISKVCTNGKPSATNVCCRYTGVTSGEPSKIGCGPSGSVCNYSTSDITTC